MAVWEIETFIEYCSTTNLVQVCHNGLILLTELVSEFLTVMLEFLLVALVLVLKWLR